MNEGANTVVVVVDSEQHILNKEYKVELTKHRVHKEHRRQKDENQYMGIM